MRCDARSSTDHDNVSPYLLRPLRTLAEAEVEIALKQAQSSAARWIVALGLPLPESKDRSSG